MDILGKLAYPGRWSEQWRDDWRSCAFRWGNIKEDKEAPSVVAQTLGGLVSLLIDGRVRSVAVHTRLIDVRGPDIASGEPPARLGISETVEVAHTQWRDWLTLECDLRVTWGRHRSLPSVVLAHRSELLLPRPPALPPVEAIGEDGVVGGLYPASAHVMVYMVQSDVKTIVEKEIADALKRAGRRSEAPSLDVFVDQHPDLTPAKLRDLAIEQGLATRDGTGMVWNSEPIPYEDLNDRVKYRRNRRQDRGESSD